jgi:transcriptional regulator GlxA family with amidase domain
VTDLAAHALLSPRTFARQFTARTGTTPHQWLTRARLMRAQELLERSDDSIEQIASQCGLSPLMLRRHFARMCGTTPQAYRRTFSQAGPVLRLASADRCSQVA